MNLKEKMHERVNKRVKRILDLADKLHRQIDQDRIGGEEGREWLDQYAIGKGLNFACGDFSIGDSLGVDGDVNKLAADYLVFWEEVSFKPKELDYIVTNYFEAIGNPLRMLEEWNARLKNGGILAMVCQNADKYITLKGPLENNKRKSCFNKKILSFYLRAVNFEIIECQEVENQLWIAARKNA